MLFELGPLLGGACSLRLVLFVAGPPRIWARSSFACESVGVHGLHGDCTLTMPTATCHGPECSGSRRAPVESMAVVQSPWRPWTPTDSHAKEERAHMRGGPATKRTKRKEQAPPRRGPSSKSMQMVTTQGLER
ncbi:uncharacterized protein UDID_17417 [Ustilago sp. UG-2017a]|nr:uncharacterized protein UDID_17417 [Ustilago sp. UG-2017a]